MHECCRYEDACAEVAREEDEVVRDWETWEPAYDDGEGACCCNSSVSRGIAR